MLTLERIGEPAAWVVADVLRDRSLGLFAAKVLGRIGAAAVEPTLVVFNESRRGVLRDGDPVFTYAATALADIGAPAIDSLFALLYDRHESVGVRAGATEALGRMGAAAEPALREALRVNDPFVRRCAAAALGMPQED